LFECNGNRTCNLDPNSCLACDNLMPLPCAAGCLISDTQAHPGRIEQAATDCPTQFADTPDPLIGTMVTLEPTQQPCSFMLRHEGGTALLGTFRSVGLGQWLGDFPSMGGECTGIEAPTDAIRIIWSCRSCQFVLGL
jgi:hypothetical protein